MEPGLREELYKLMDRSMTFLSKVDNVTFKAFWQGYQCIIINCLLMMTYNKQLMILKSQFVPVS